MPIERVSLGGRIATKNPRREDYDFNFSEPDESSWARVSLERHRIDGGTVDVELLRPLDWIQSHGIAVGRMMRFVSEELEVTGVAKVTALAACPPLSHCDGHVVTGRFVTRQVSQTVTFTFSTGDTLEGTLVHPIWSPAIQD